MKSLRNKISLGTAKLGVENYGFSSNDLPKDKIKFLEKSFNIGIKSLDTSPRYGNSERIIGNFIDKTKQRPFVSSKIDGLKKNDNHSPRKMIESVKRSLDRMRIPFLDVCYLHQNDLDIISDPYVHEGLIELKEIGLIKNCGTSIYKFEELDYTVESALYDFIQVPINILDTSYYDRIIDYQTEIRIIARSIFLQGIFFHPASIKEKIKENKLLLQYLQKITTICESYGFDLNIGCIAFIHALERIEQLIIGTSSIENLKSNFGSLNQELNKDTIDEIYEISKDPKPWTNPKDWT